MKHPVLFLFIILMTLSACRHDGSGDTAAPIAEPKVVVEPAQALLWEVGASTQLQADLVSADGQSLAGASQFEWLSSNESIVRVSATGEVTAAGEGEAVVSVRVDGRTAQVKVTVDTAITLISGQVRYQDREYSLQGFTGVEPYKAVRFAVADVLDGSGALVTTITTDAEGRFSFTGFAAGNYTLRVLAKTDVTTGYSVEISDMSDSLYAVSKALDLTVPDQVVVDIPRNSGLSGVFNMLDVMVTGAQFIEEVQVGALPQLNIFWAPYNADGTYYCTGYDYYYCSLGAGIYVLNQGSTSDTDEFDDDVLLHEFAHFVADRFSRDDSRGGCHTLSATDLDLRLAWSEGWGDYFPPAVKQWLSADPSRVSLLSIPSSSPKGIYVDTAGSYAQIGLNVGEAKSSYRYAGSEVAVAKILWDLTERFGAAQVWRVLADYLPMVADSVNLESFWDGWLVTNADSDLTQLKNIFRARQVFYEEDVYEADDGDVGLRKIALSTSEEHHLYRADGVFDVDRVALDVVQGRTYTVETFNLRNGADTYLKVLNEQGTMVAENDDQFPETRFFAQDFQCGVQRATNDDLALSSKLTFTAATTGTYIVHASSTPDNLPYPSAGRYGSYTLRVTAQ